jgi:enamine deaminase RidA (YjgF/YER057c/UK114 family)
MQHVIHVFRRLSATAVVLFIMIFAASAAGAEPTGTPGDTIRRVKSGSASDQSQAVIVNGMPLAHTAQLMGTSADGRLVGGDDVAIQTRQALANVTAALASIGSSRGRIAKLNVYVTRDDVAPQVRQVLK